MPDDPSPPADEPEPRRQIRWLHLSDLHFRAGESWDTRATLKALLQHQREEKEAGRGPDFVFVTGDVAFSGKPEEYELAEFFFRQLAKDLGLEPHEHFFFVPGNHDVDRGEIGPSRFIAQSLDPDVLEEVMSDAGTMDQLGRRLETFYAFTHRLQGPARALHSSRPFRVDVREVGGVRLGVLQLNSAWVSGPDDEKDRLVLGTPQLRTALEEAADAFVRVALVHHPTADLRVWDKAGVEELLGAPGGVHFLLYGHRHRTGTFVQSSPDGHVVHLAAGATLDKKPWPRSFLSAQLDLDDGRAEVRYFRYSDRGRGFWTADTGAYEAAKADGVWRFDLAPGLCLDDGAAASPAELTETRRESLAARYRAAVAAVHGTVRFIGFSARKARPQQNVRVPDLFVPLQLSPRGRHGEEVEPLSTEALLKCLTTPGDGVTRLVVLGGPGSGKTTLCRFAAVMIAEGDDDLLPLFLPFRDYVRKGVDSIVDYLEEQARNHLQLPLPGGFIKEALDAGRAVLILDGLDEVGSAKDRDATCEKVQAFVASNKKVAVLVTSRPAGYHDAPLPETFEHLELRPFNDDEQRAFVENWYKLQEPAEPGARDEGIAGLQAALAARPRVRELARNPLLATLIALVHRTEATLPGERAQLYDRCVATLIETWPKATDRRFDGLDPGRQRAYLETLAWRMQCSRNANEREVSIERDELVETLSEVIAARSSQDDAEERGLLVERWVSFLEKGSGLLVEQRPGVFSFFHLSLMEYLAAQELLRLEHPAKAMARRYRESGWREVCLLAVGSRATDKSFLDRVFERVRGEDDKGRWDFLFEAMREEADFDDAQRDVICRAVALETLSSYNWRQHPQAFDEILRLSLRHDDWAAGWLDERLATASGDELRGLVLLRLKQWREVRGKLEGRSDRADAAADLVGLWPAGDVGAWTAEHADRRRLLRWARDEAPHELSILHPLDALDHRWQRLMPALLVRHLEACRRFAALERAGRRQLAEEPRRGGRGLPEAIRVSVGFSTLSTVWLWPGVLPKENDEPLGPSRDFARDFARDSATDFATDFAGDLARDFMCDFASDFTRGHASPFTRDSTFFVNSFALDFTRDFARDFMDSFGLRFVFDFEPDSAREFASSFARCIKREFASSFALKPDSLFEVLPPDLSRDPGDLLKADEAFRQDDNNAGKEHLARFFARRIGEIWLGYTTACRREHYEADAYAQRRGQHRWLLDIWPEVDRRLGKAPSSDAIALYLALGWTQACSTWTFPGTGRWVETIAAGPPRHWLPRSQWHLCWLIYKEDAVHRQGLRDALDEGEGDEERPGVAAAIRELVDSTTD